MANALILQPLPLVGVTASGTTAGAPANIGNDYAGIIWRSNVAGSATLNIDLGADQPVDTIAIFGIAFSTFTSAATLQVTLQPDAGAPWVDTSQALLAGAQMPVSGFGTALWMPAAASPPASARYVTLVFSWTSTRSIDVARLVIGKRIQLSRNFSYGGSFGVKDLGTLDFSARGVLMRRRAKKLRTTALTFSNVRKDEVEAQTRPLLEQIGNTEMVALVTDPGADAQRQNRCYYGALVGDLGHTQRNAAGWEAKANLVSIF